MLRFLNRRHSIGVRIGLIAAFGTAPIFLLLFLFVSQVGKDIRITRQELAGAAYLSEIWPLVTTAAAGAGPADGAVALGRAQAFQADDAAKVFADATGSAKVDAGLALVKAVADGSKLTLDPDLDSFYAMNAASVDLPRLLAASEATAQAATAQDRAVALQRVEVYVDASAGSVDALIANDATGLARSALGSRLDAVRTAANAMEAQAGAASPQSGQASHQALRRAIDDLWKANCAELVRLLEARLTRLERALALNLGLVTLAMGLAGMVMIGTARGLTDRFRALGETMDRLNAKDTSVEVPFLSDTNETGRIAATLAALKQGLIEVEEERRRADVEQRRADAVAVALSESEARFRSLAEQATDIIVRYDPNGLVEYASPSIRQIGLDPEAIVGTEFADIYPEEARAGVKWFIASLIQGGSLPEGHRPLAGVRGPDGQWRWLEGNPSVIRDEAHKVIGAMTVLRDVTVAVALENELREQKQRVEAAMEAVAASEARYRMLAERITDVIVRYDTNGIIEYISPSVRQLGYEPEDMIGHHIAEYQSQPDAGTTALARLNAGEPIPSGAQNEYPLRRGDSGTTWMQGNPSAILNDSGEPIGIVTSLRDISERRAMEDELRRKRAEAEHAAEAKAQFLANMSHEIRTPLTSIIGFGGLLDRMEGLPAQARVYLKRISDSGEVLLSLVNDILDFTRIEGGEVKTNLQAVDPMALLGDTVELVRPVAAQRGLDLRLDPAPSVPPIVSIDADRVRQVVLNLIGNALKFTGEGSIRVEAAYSPADGGVLRVAVTDTGIGIPPDRLARLFQRFSQVDDSNTRQHGGAGLGLAISKGLIEKMGGEIGVESVDGGGSTFWFTVAAPIVDRVSAPEPIEDEPPDLTPLRILVVDDVPMNRILVSALLAPFEPMLEEAADGVEAVQAAEREHFDLILMDLQMPRMDGLEATRAIRASSGCNKATPILAVTANVLPEHVESCRVAGMNDHIGKPISAHELLSKVGRWTAADDAAA